MKFDQIVIHNTMIANKSGNFKKDTVVYNREDKGIYIQLGNKVERFGSNFITESKSFNLAPDNWVEDTTDQAANHGDYKYYIDIIDNEITAKDIVEVKFNDISIPYTHAVSPNVETFDGIIRVRAAEIPSEYLSGVYYIIGKDIA